MKLSIITATHKRPESLIKVAADSLLSQTNLDFEWVVINDGRDIKTREAIRQFKAPFQVKYYEIDHALVGFGMCHARNKGLEVASGEIVSYLDDDNNFYPNFTSETLNIFINNPSVRYSMCRQQTRRDVVDGTKIVQKGQEYTKPSLSTTTLSLTKEQDRFDSNGFTHYPSAGLNWNPSYNLLADFEFFLNCVNVWGEDTFHFNPKILLDYIQSSTGQVGMSTAGDSHKEYSRLHKNHKNYALLRKYGGDQLAAAINRYGSRKHEQRHAGFFL